MDYDVNVAYDGSTALELIRKNPYDIALLDFKMPDMDGVTLSQEIRKLRAGTVSLIVTAYANAETTDEALRSGVWQVLPKPVDFSRLLTLVETAMGQPMIMVVDDDRELCENLWELFRDHDLRVCTAHDTDEAQRRLGERSYQVVLIDLKLPQGDGTEVLKSVHELNPAARTILVTGYRSEMTDVIEKALQGEADAVCYKPFDIPALLSQIEDLRRKES
jgi:DNA-binding NtrC family response regulator